MDGNGKTPGIRQEPVSAKKPRAKLTDQALKASHIKFRWSLVLADREGKWAFGDKVFGGRDWCLEILPKLKDFEGKTWAIIANQSSGRSSGTRNYHIARSALVKGARKRLKQIDMNDLDELYSLRLDGKRRLFGVVQDHVLKLLWYDPRHEICPSTRG